MLTAFQDIDIFFYYSRARYNSLQTCAAQQGGKDNSQVQKSMIQTHNNDQLFERLTVEVGFI